MDFYRAANVFFVAGMCFGLFDLGHTWWETHSHPVPVSEAHLNRGVFGWLSPWLPSYECLHVKGLPDLLHAVNDPPGDNRTPAGTLFIAVPPPGQDVMRANRVVILKHSDPRARPLGPYGQYLTALRQLGKDKFAFRPYPALQTVFTGMATYLPPEFANVRTLLALKPDCDVVLLDMEQPLPEQYASWMFVVVFGFALIFLKILPGCGRSDSGVDRTETRHGKRWTILFSDGPPGWHVWPPFAALTGGMAALMLARELRSAWLAPLLVYWLPVCLALFAMLPAALIFLLAAAHRETLLCNGGLVLRNTLTGNAESIPWMKLMHLELLRPTWLFPGGKLHVVRADGTEFRVPLYGPAPKELVDRVIVRFLTPLRKGPERPWEAVPEEPATPSTPGS